MVDYGVVLAMRILIADGTRAYVELDCAIVSNVVVDHCHDRVNNDGGIVMSLGHLAGNDRHRCYTSQYLDDHR